MAQEKSTIDSESRAFFFFFFHESLEILREKQRKVYFLPTHRLISFSTMLLKL